MKDMKELLQAAHSDIASIVVTMQTEEPRRYDDWHSAEAALTAQRAVADAVDAAEMLRGSISAATDALDSIIDNADDNADGLVLEFAVYAQEALNRVWNFSDPDTSSVPPEAVVGS